MPYADPEAGRQYSREYYRKNREQVLQRVRQRSTGVTQEQFVDRLAEQGGVCAICSAPEPGGRGDWHADHSHATGAFRGVLCHACNSGIGLLADDPDRLLAAAAYLVQHEG